MDFFKTIVTRVIIFFEHLFLLLPIDKKKILFYPTNGHYYCNLKYIDKKIAVENEKIKIIWVKRRADDDSYPNDISFCNYHDIKFLYHFFTSSIIIFNNNLPVWVFKRHGQIFINTWHGGGAYKKIDKGFSKIPNQWKKKRIYRIVNSIDYVVSSCKRFSYVFEKDIGSSMKFLPFGMPRNDIFFDANQMQHAVDLVREKYRIQPDKGIVLYAPTFRDNGMRIDLDVNRLLSSLQLRFKKSFILLVRSHPHLAKDIFSKVQRRDEVIDVSKYVDMQELLAAADVLITDYSSSIWDFSFTGRPCFIYANDLSSYKKERNFHTPIDEWPFPLAENNEEMVRNIENFNSDIYKERIFEHHRALGSYENGTASEQIGRLIKAICYKNEKNSGEK
ncbi:CDP-glycerol glycerophosphotransferase family protein [Mitsuokella sp. AF21-1AC]|uniref:CDP-glycerol glycerophosphotransferase family protein n=1 Tax=Mitsuokella sp. AF21-1AC TaxID=2292235 RepID=UPI001315003C|nr:CDP-glycerol glycerophosphotransferase family protein [Mitsuokella sp. AF21-1AC]